MIDDFEFAKKLQEDEYKVSKWNKDSKPRPLMGSSKENVMQPTSLIDPSWEIIDPNPNIHSLFIAFDKKYFWNSLGSVEVKWSPRMYTCAGICTYKGRGGCVVSLSLPLLKLRPRKDLIETLLHEMIHAYLFLTKNDRDRDGHGPRFHSHMFRINAEAGTKITVYHTFHDEVRHYKTHWWRCDGPCRFRKPYFGIVKRAMNRAPGRNDFWFAEHQTTCGGNFIKIQEPEGFKSRKKKGGATTIGHETGFLMVRLDGQVIKYGERPTSDIRSLGESIEDLKIDSELTIGKTADIRDFFGTNQSPKKPSYGLVSPSLSANPMPKKLDFPPKSSETPSSQKTVGKPHTAGAQSNSTGLNGAVKKINKAGNIHGFDSVTGGASRSGLKSNMGGTLIENPKTTSNGKPIDLPGGSAENKLTTVQPFSGTGYVLAPPGVTIDRSKSKLLSLYAPPPSKKPKITETSSEPPSSQILVPCPVCGIDVRPSEINQHLDSCVQIDLSEEPVDVKNLPPSPQKSLFANCPVCGKSVYKTKINEHIDECIQNNAFEDIADATDTNTPSTSSGFTTDPPSPSKGLFANCPVCDKKVFKNKMDEHLDSCIRLDSIMDSSGCEIVDLDEEEDEVSVKEVRCPCCDKVFSPSDINAHLDSCLHYKDFE